MSTITSYYPNAYQRKATPRKKKFYQGKYVPEQRTGTMTFTGLYYEKGQLHCEKCKVPVQSLRETGDGFSEEKHYHCNSHHESFYVPAGAESRIRQADGSVLGAGVDHDAAARDLLQRFSAALRRAEDDVS